MRVVNHSGHKLPTGYPEGRQMWIHLKAYDAGGQVIYESGAYDPVTGILVRDADIQVYEAKQGLTPEIAAVLGLIQGNPSILCSTTRWLRITASRRRGIRLRILIAQA